MSNPWIVRAGPFAWPNVYGGSGSDNVTALPDNTTVGIGYVQLTNPNGNPLTDIILPPWRVVSGASVSGTGTFKRWLVVGETPNLFTGGLDPTSGNDQTVTLDNYFLTNGAALNAMGLYEQINVLYPNTAYYFLERYMKAVLGNLPKYMGFLIQNTSGGPLSIVPTDNVIQYSLDQ